MEVLRDVDNRTKWDNNLREAKVIREFSDCFIIFRNVAPMPIIQDRDFVEKMLIFQHNGAYYIYYSSIPDKFFPPQSGYTRGYTMYAVNRIKKEGNKIIVRTSTQKDPQASMSGFMSLGMVGGKSAENITNFRLRLMKQVRRVTNHS